MKLNKLLLMALLVSLTACNESNNSSSIEQSSSASESNIEESSTLPVHSSVEQSSSISESSSVEESTTILEPLPEIDVSDKEAYKALVDRTKINYSNDFENDPTHDVTSLEIYQINDTHGAFINTDEVIGISKVATAIKENTYDPYAVVKIANGDILQGSAFSNMLLGEPGIAALNEMNFDCFVLGNHEFDWGIDNLSVYKDGNPDNGELECEFLGANVRDGQGNLPSWIKPYTIVNKGDVKVGIIGVVGENLETSISEVSLRDYYFESTTTIVQTYSEILIEQENVDVIIVAEHGEKSTGYAKEVKVDCIINGHEHRDISTFVDRFDGVKVPVVESQTKNLSMGKVTLTLDESNKMVSSKIEHYEPKNYAEDSNLKAIMEVYNEVTSAYENEVIAYNEGGLSKAEIGIMTCTYIAQKYDADIAMTNNGGVRASITEDYITNAMMYEAMPFDNELYIAYLTGEELRKVVGSGMYYNKSGIGNGTNVLVTKIDKNKTYKVVCVDYVANKLVYQNYFNEAHGLIKTGDLIRDCGIEAVKIKYPIS